MTGFTSGIAVIIFSSQIKDLLGLRMGAVPAPVPGEVGARTRPACRHVLAGGVAVAAGSLAILLVWPRCLARVPAPIVAHSRRLAWSWRSSGCRSKRSDRASARSARRFPPPRLPVISLERVRELFSPAVTVALLAAIESLLSAVVADGMIGSRHKSNVELVAQGIANIGVGALRRHARDRSDRAHGDQRQDRRTDAGRRNDARARRCC